MPEPRINVELDAKNYYIQLLKEDEIKIEKAINQIHIGKVLFQQANATSNAAIKMAKIAQAFCCYAKGIQLSQLAKVNGMIRKVRECLREVPNSKHVLTFFNLEPIKIATEKLKDLNPVVLTGASSSRKKIIKTFNENPDCRVAIVNIRVASLGISLHDTVGNSPRYLWITPTYFVSDMHQMTYRIYRLGAQSKATVRFIYSKGHKKEVGLITSIAKHCNVMKLMMSSKLNIRFPSDYPEEIEY